ncbi:probable myosin-binding protein 5 [Trifolium pratense]|uniref:probable myosin-binding protein 5 n=1 Tax=Trifolium pratense TaxID=57577 RepID=UPI001E6921AD|nr:probable myosin-binding protein 5 [Trifolium pratense]
MASRSFSHFVEEEMGKFPHFVIYMLLEWVLIFILFLDGFLAFVANEFARFFELKIPCWLCTRFDHVMVHRNPDFYYNESVCEAHKKDMSSLAFCHNHKKLSDIRKMCEGCLLSFATEKESDCDTYKSLVGILHKDLECFVEDGQPIQLSLKDDDGFMMQFDMNSSQKCSCCGQPLKVKSASSYSSSTSSYLPKTKRSDSFARAPTPSPKAFPFSTSKNDEPNALDLPHIGYTPLKFMTRNDSEVKEENDGRHNVKLKEDTKSAVPLLAEGEDIHDDASKYTPTFTRGNKFFGIPLSDSTNNSPRWSYRFNKKSPLEKTELANESNEVINAIQNDFDDAMVNNLKRQVRLDRKSLMALYMELDEERSASAVAANNAMAMITRLQAEKAAVQMEALQYQRMMEEQAEYDEEALQATNEILVKREEEIRNLEDELEFYRNKYGILTDEGGGCNNTPSYRHNEGRGEDQFKDIRADKTYLLGRMKKIGSRSTFSENGGAHSLHSDSESSVNNIDSETEKEGNEA